MAEPSAPESPASAGPALGSTADSAPYVPVSWLAVAAAGSAGLLGLLLLVLGFVHFRAKRPLLEEQLLIFAILAIVLSFAARRVIRNSEGTRTGTLFGIDLPNAAWWGGLVLGLGYVSYLMAIEFSIQRDARNEAQTWSENVLKGDDEGLNRAFHRTQDPSQRRNVPATNGELLEARWGKEYTAFRQCDLRRLIARNPKDTTLQIGGLREWRYLPTGVECVYTGTITCPEGTFPLLFPMRGTESSGSDTGGRQWQLIHGPNGFIDKERAKLTPYGWFIAHIGISGANLTRELMMSTGTREGRATVYPNYVSNDPETEKFFRPLTVGGAQLRASIVGATAAYAFTPGPKFLDFTAERLFTLPGGAKADDTRMTAFKQAWATTGIVRAGDRIRESTDVNDQVVISDAGIFYRMPVEIPMPSTRGEIVAARAGLVFECVEPGLMDELKNLKASADPASGTDAPPASIQNRRLAFKLLRIESDLKPIKSEPPKMPDAPPQPGAP